MQADAAGMRMHCIINPSRVFFNNKAQQTHQPKRQAAPGILNCSKRESITPARCDNSLLPTGVSTAAKYAMGLSPLLQVWHLQPGLFYTRVLPQHHAAVKQWNLHHKGLDICHPVTAYKCCNTAAGAASTRCQQCCHETYHSKLVLGLTYL
jgi:hypothetical protein